MIEVACGIIFHEEKILLARRKKGKIMAGKWEFPGGKIEPGESAEAAVTRELHEELGMNVRDLKFIGSTTHPYPDFTVQLHGVQCTFVSATYTLIDHDLYAWVTKEELLKYDLSEADKRFIDFLL
jgi:8-oxo-dGTP diphosphatase